MFFLHKMMQFADRNNKRANDTYINSLYVALDNKSSTYYVGIGGTNAISAANWVLEDFQVNDFVEWPYGGTYFFIALLPLLLFCAIICIYLP